MGITSSYLHLHSIKSSLKKKNILEFKLPNAWLEKMVLHGFDPVIHTPFEFVALYERHEITEGNLNHSDDKKVPKPKPVQRTGQATENIV
jgi:hypothetical protein